jgi:K+ transport systems, NAD-binding component
MAGYRRRGAQQEFAVIGLGRFGSSVALTLMSRGHSVLGIDRDPEIVQDLSDRLTQAVALDSTDEAALQAVDIASFRTVVIGIGTNFEANLMTMAAVKSLCTSTVICKATTERQRDILLKLGADRVVLPEFEAGARLAENLAHPGQINSMDVGSDYCITEMRAPSETYGRMLHDASFTRRYHVFVVAVRRGSRVIPTPPPDFEVAAGDTLVVLGAADEILRLTDDEG